MKRHRDLLALTHLVHPVDTGSADLAPLAPRGMAVVRSSVDRDRLRRIRNYQSQDWYPALVIRPLTILVMLAVADWPAVTPNRVTTLANLAKLVAAWLIAFAPDRWVAAAILLQLGVLLDNLDGTVARYRRSFNKLGSVYDKASDLATWFVISLAVGWAAYQQTGDALLLVLAMIGAFCLDLRGYLKWLLVAEGERVRWLEARADPVAAVAQRTRPIAVTAPPRRDAAGWLRWFAGSMLSIGKFEEADLFFWVGLGLVLGRLDLLCWLLALSQALGALGVGCYRMLEAHRLDRRLAELAP